MIKLRLKRFGKKREASFRLVATNSTSRRDGRPLEELARTAESPVHQHPHRFARPMLNRRRRGVANVRRCTVHNWINRGSKSCIVAVILIHSKPVEVGAKALTAFG
jgi:ribosomal protein S16